MRKKVGKRTLSDRAGEDAPYPTTIRLYILAVSAMVEHTMEQPPKIKVLFGGV